jgi:hypothetical protein
VAIKKADLTFVTRYLALRSLLSTLTTAEFIDILTLQKMKQISYKAGLFDRGINLPGERVASREKKTVAEKGSATSEVHL